jgi:hypothetical protein
MILKKNKSVLTDSFLHSAQEKVKNIKELSLTIYNDIENENKHLWLSCEELSSILNHKLIGISFFGLANRTKSKKAKQIVADALGYHIPKSFKRCQPRFKGQFFDTYILKANNLQIWNEELDIKRRYVLIRTNEFDVITEIKIVSGSDIKYLDTTGKITTKYQASLKPSGKKNELISKKDTINISSILTNEEINLKNNSPIEPPSENAIIPIEECFNILKSIIGKKIPNIGSDRTRGDYLHSIVCKTLGYTTYKDNGKFPDINHQLLEIKLQTSNTIDLGLIYPDSNEPLSFDKIKNTKIECCDVRYAIFLGDVINGDIVITSLYLTTGKDFFTRFKAFGGNVKNGKLQLIIPKDFFLTE